MRYKFMKINNTVYTHNITLTVIGTSFVIFVIGNNCDFKPSKHVGKFIVISTKYVNQ
jgi:hypothetical protein